MSDFNEITNKELKKFAFTTGSIFIVLFYALELTPAIIDIYTSIKGIMDRELNVKLDI